MFDLLLNTNTVADSLTFGGTLAICGAALALGLYISLVYIFSRKKEIYSPAFAVMLIILPAIIAMIILLIGSNVARAFSLAGAFSIIRFRSAPGDAKDMAFVLLCMGVGMSCGMGYLGYAALFAFILCTAMAALAYMGFAAHQPSPARLRISLPEDMNYHGTFDDILALYTDSSKLIRVKTSEFGSLFELTYDVKMKDMAYSKELIDKLRCKNGNLNIVLAFGEIKGDGVF